MRSRVSACLIFSVVLCPCLCAAEGDPRAVIEALRDQMKQLQTLEAEYIVESVYGASRAPKTEQLTYTRDGERFYIVETETDPNGREVLRHAVYNGLDIKTYIRDSAQGGRSGGAVFPASYRTARFTDNDLMLVSEFSMAGPGVDENFAQGRYEVRDNEFVDGHDCLVVVCVTPFLAGHEAFNYHWIEVDGSRYLLRRYKCLIDDKLGMLLYEKQFAYGSSGYPFPTEIQYRRYDIDPQGYRILDYEKSIRIESVRINESIDPRVFNYAFPEGTVVNAAPPTVSEAALKNPDPMREPDPSELPFDPSLTQPDPRTEFPLDPSEGLVFVPVQFGPEPLAFVLDTGCTHTLFDLSFRPQLGHSLGTSGGSTPGGQIAVEVFVAPRAFVGPFNIAECGQVGCVNLSAFSLSLGRPIDGLLGMSVLKSHVVRIDLDEGRVAFLDDGEDRRDWGEAFPLSYTTAGLPQVRLSLEGVGEYDFVIDTGYAGSGALAEDVFDLVVAQGDSLPVSTVNLSAASTVESSEYRTGLIELGPFQYRGLIFAKSGSNILGLMLLARHVVTLDFPHNRLYLKEGKRFGEQDESGMSGVSLIRSDGQTVVREVYEDEPAAKAGIEIGDVILTLQGRDVNTCTVWDIRGLLRSGDGKEVTMTIQRGDEVKEITVVLERRI